jgi:hypothetical protein
MDVLLGWEYGINPFWWKQGYSQRDISRGVCFNVASKVIFCLVFLLTFLAECGTLLPMTKAEFRNEIRSIQADLQSARRKMLMAALKSPDKHVGQLLLEFAAKTGSQLESLTAVMSERLTD